MTVNATPMTELPPTRRGGVLLRRRVARLGPGAVALTHAFDGNGTRVLVTNAACLLAQVDVVRGSISFPLSSGHVQAPGRFVLWVAPRSVVPIQFDAASVRSDGIGMFDRIAPGSSALFCWPEGAALSAALTGGATLASLESDAGVSFRVAAARARLHDRLHERAPVRSVANDVGLDVDALTRAFTRAYVLSPKQYCHRARLFDASLRLLSGAAIVSAALDAGFNDLSRFYAQFRRLLRTTPATYARAGKRQDGRGALP
jgi:AraC-like DNA-binding protein